MEVEPFPTEVDGYQWTTHSNQSVESCCQRWDSAMAALAASCAVEAGDSRRHRPPIPCRLVASMKLKTASELDDDVLNKYFVTPV